MTTKFDLNENVNYQDHFNTFRAGKITKIFITENGVDYYINDEVISEFQVFKTEQEFKTAKKDYLQKQKIDFQDKIKKIDNDIKNLT